MPATAMLSEPVLGLSVNGQPAASVLADIIGLKLVSALNEPASCELKLNNVREENGQLISPYLGLAALKFGDELRLSVRDDDGSTVLFTGKINRVESRMEDGKLSVFIVRAGDALQNLSRSERTRVFKDSSDAHMIESICQQNGLTCDADLPGPFYRSKTQLNQRDLEFIQQRLTNAGGYAFMADGSVVVRPLLIQPAVNSELPVSEFARLSLAADLSDQSDSLGVAGWDVQAKQAIAQAAAAGDLQVPGVTGGAMLAQQLLNTDSVNVSQVPDDDQQAEATAQALYRQQALQFVTGNGELRGFYLRRPGDNISLTGIGEGFSGTFLVSQRILRYDRELGHFTNLRLHSAALFQH